MAHRRAKLTPFGRLLIEGGQVHSSGTMMWTFEEIDPGTYTVQATAALFPEDGAFIPYGSGAHVLQEPSTFLTLTKTNQIPSVT